MASLERNKSNIKSNNKPNNLSEGARKYVEELEEGLWKQIQQLEVSKEQYRVAVEGSLVGIYVLQEGVFKYANPAFLKIFGYGEPGEIIGRPWKEVVFKEDIEKVLATGIEERMKGKGKPIQYIFRALKKGGVVFDAEVLSQPSFYENKPAAIGSLQDITERKRAEEKIKRLYSFQAAIRHINQLIVRIKDEKEFFQQTCNVLKESAFIKFAWIGLTEKGIYEVKPAAQAGFEEDYLSSIKVTWDESEYGKGPTGIAIKSREPVVMTDIMGDPRYKPWREQALKRGYLSSAAIPFVYENEVIGALNVYSGEKDFFGGEEIGFLKEVAGDIAVGVKSLRKERALEESEEKFRIIFDEANDGILLADTESKNFYFANKKICQMLGYSLEEIKNLGVTDVHPKESSSYVKDQFEKQLKKEIAVSSELPVQRKDGSIFFADVNASPVMIAGKPYLMGIFRDVTERKKSEDRLKELDELRNKFIQIVSHQLRTPLNSIRWSMEALLAGEMDHLKESQSKLVHISYDAGIEVISRINDLLTALDIEEGRVPRLSLEQVSLESLLSSVMINAKKKSELKKIHCECQLPKEPLPAIKMDTEKIRIVFEKLFDNALSYTKEDGKVTARLVKNDNLIRFEVSDTGVGIPKAEQKNVFYKFYRCSNASAMKPDASGIGLYISKYFVEQHGGTMGFESEEGKGSTFWFELPITQS